MQEEVRAQALAQRAAEAAKAPMASRFMVSSAALLSAIVALPLLAAALLWRRQRGEPWPTADRA
jgi:hypothetical protein